MAAARAAVAALRGCGADVALADLHALAHARMAAWRMEHPGAADFDVRVPVWLKACLQLLLISQTSRWQGCFTMARTQVQLNKQYPQAWELMAV